MESSALLANIALIVSKDLLNDEKAVEQFEPSHLTIFDDDEDIDEAECFFFHQQQKKRQKLDSTQKILGLDLLNQFDSQTFENLLHLSKPTFLRIFECIRILLPKKHFPNVIEPQTAFSLALWKMCRDEHFEEIARRFDVPFLDLQTAIRQFWKIISNNEARFLRMNHLVKHQSKRKNAKNELIPQRPIGVVAIKKLDIFLESNDQEVQVIWQLVCNANGKILDCYVQALQDYDFDASPVGRMLSNQSSSQRKMFLIGDNNFSLKTYLITPIPSPNSDGELKFNKALEASLTRAQDIFDALAMRFNALYALESKDLYEVRRIISTICCLHNLCVDINENYARGMQQETIKSVNWSKPVNIGNNKQQPSQEAATRRRNELLDEFLNSKIAFFL